jgi:MFS family permease
MTTSADVELMRRSRPEWAADAERHLRRNYVLMTADMASFSFAITLLSETTILPAFVKTLTAAPVALGFLAAIYALGHFLPQLAGSYLAMLTERRKPLLVAICAAERVGILLIALAAQLVGVTTQVTVLLVFFLAFAFYSTTTGLIGPVYGDFIAKSIVRHRGWLYGGAQLLGGLMGAGAAALADRFLSTLPYPIGIQACFWTAFALSFISLLFVVNFHEVHYPDREPRIRARELLARIPGILRENRAYRWFLTARTAMAVGTMGVGFAAGAALDRGLVTQDAAVLALVYLAAQSAGGLAWGVIGDRLGWKRVLMLAAGCLALAMLVAVEARGIGPFIATFVLLGGVNSAAMMGDPNITYEVAPPSETSRYLGITSTVLAPTLALAPLIGAVIAALFSYEAVFITAAVFAVVGLVIATAKFVEPRRLLAVVPPSAVG